MRGAGVGAATCTYHPVRLAQWVAENTPHVLLAGEDCAVYAKKAGVLSGRLVPTAAARKKRASLLADPALRAHNAQNPELWSKVLGGGTVGAVAVDSSGVASAAVSTGGVWLKLPGRIGDSAVIGAGAYANAKGAASATGVGEEIIKCGLSMRACELLKAGRAPAAARRSISLITRRSGRDTAGIITVDSKGKVGASWNTEAMGRGWYDLDRQRVVVRV